MRFSIGIPAYKSLFLKECIFSVLMQDFTDFELIIINDNSPDDIKSIVFTFSDSRINYYENSINTGAENVVDNWNKCLSFAQGEYFVLLGDDDVLDVNYLTEFNSLINKFPNLNIYHCRSKLIDENGKILRLSEPRPEIESVFDLMNERIKDQRIQYVSDFVYKTSVLRKNKGFYKLPLAWYSDDITAYMAASEGGIANTNLPVFNYRTTQHTITSTGSSKLKLIALEKATHWIKSFLKTTEDISFLDNIIRLELLSKLDNYYFSRRIHILSLDYVSETWIALLKNIFVENKKYINISEFFKSFLVYFFRNRKKI